MVQAVASAALALEGTGGHTSERPAVCHNAVCSSRLGLSITHTYGAAHCRDMPILRLYRDGIARLTSVICVQAQHGLIAAPWHLPVQLRVQSEYTMYTVTPVQRQACLQGLLYCQQI